MCVEHCAGGGAMTVCAPAELPIVLSLQSVLASGSVMLSFVGNEKVQYDVPW